MIVAPVTAFHVRVADDVVGGGGGWVVEGDNTKLTGTVYLQTVILIVTVALRVPAVSPLVFTAAVSFALLVIDVVAGDTLSQVALSEAVSVTVPEEVLEKVIVWFGGFAAPCTA